MKTILIPGEQFRIQFLLSGTSVHTATMVDYETGNFELGGVFTYRMDFEEWEILPVRPLYA